MVQTALQSLSEMLLPADDVPGWLAGISNERSRVDIERIERAAYFAIKAHHGQKRASGEDYVNHTFAVAAIVHELGLDSEVVIAALLHDTVEDTLVTLARSLELMFLIWSMVSPRWKLFRNCLIKMIRESQIKMLRLKAYAR